MSEETRGRVIMWYPTTLINCACQEGKVSIIVTTGFMNPSRCGACGAMYQNKGFTEEPGPGGFPGIIVDVIPPTPVGKVM